MTPDTIDVDVESGELPTTALALRRPDTPTTLSELAALGGGALEVIEARVLVLETLHRAAIRATSPEDWLLFKSPEEQGGQVTGYLQDCGADRVRDLYGIEVFAVSRPEKIMGNDPAVFHYLITGSGRCKITRQVIETIEGGRSSTDDFCRGKSGAELELLVRKAARANLDGNVTRELSGLKSVPVSDLQDAWVGTKKSIDQCRRGRGFGSRDERVGGRSAKAPDVVAPICPHCKSSGVYRPANGDRKAFYGCPNYGKHTDKKFIVDADTWIKQHAITGLTPAQAAGFTGTPPVPAGPMPGADEIFGREPGQEG